MEVEEISLESVLVFILNQIDCSIAISTVIIYQHWPKYFEGNWIRAALSMHTTQDTNAG